MFTVGPALLLEPYTLALLALLPALLGFTVGPLPLELEGVLPLLPTLLRLPLEAFTLEPLRVFTGPILLLP